MSHLGADVSLRGVAGRDGEQQEKLKVSNWQLGQSTSSY